MQLCNFSAPLTEPDVGLNPWTKIMPRAEGRHSIAEPPRHPRLSKGLPSGSFPHATRGLLDPGRPKDDLTTSRISRPRPAARSACTCGPPALLRRGLYFHRDAVALHAEATSSASGPGTSAGSPGALGCKPGPAAAPSRRTSRGLPGRALQTPEPRGEPEAGPRGSASPGRCPRRLGTCRRT
ncbi:unnamed protein product [Nyctereutes procyonoides]|uniref:(raccoon dog) hypothetical protein n=1 Tax=Nyctereutes procyonoides TaxID=34880 RepID=A0A811ZMN2_NYCPR|nr:unnamed protein product [Nyctereutes procyonoides]